MKKLIWIVILIFSTTLFAQDYRFLSASTKKIKQKEYIDFLNENFNKIDSIQNSTKHFLIDGTIFNTKYYDSISNSKEGHLYTTVMYRDTLTNQFAYVLYKRSKAEMRHDVNSFTSYINADKKNRKKLKGSVIKDLVMIDREGNQHDFESIGNKIIVIDFWFTTCGPCIKEMPELNKLKEEFGTNNITWFGITYDNEEKVKRLFDKVQFDYTIIPDSKHLTERFDIRFYPTTLILDENRKVVYTGKFGPINNRVEEVKQELQKLLKTKKYLVEAGPVLQLDKE